MKFGLLSKSITFSLDFDAVAWPASGTVDSDGTVVVGIVVDVEAKNTFNSVKCNAFDILIKAETYGHHLLPLLRYRYCLGMDC